MRKLYKEITSANILGLTVEHNGLQGGDAGHGGYVKINIKDLASTAMGCEIVGHNGETFKIEEGDLLRFEISFLGDTERETLIEALKIVVKELEEHQILDASINEIITFKEDDID